MAPKKQGTSTSVSVSPLFGRFDDEGGYMPTDLAFMQTDEGSPWASPTWSTGRPSFLDMAYTPFSSDSQAGGQSAMPHEAAAGILMSAVDVEQMRLDAIELAQMKEEKRLRQVESDAKVAADLAAVLQADTQKAAQAAQLQREFDQYRVEQAELVRQEARAEAARKLNTNPEYIAFLAARQQNVVPMALLPVARQLSYADAAGPSSGAMGPSAFGGGQAETREVLERIDRLGNTVANSMRDLKGIVQSFMQAAGGPVSPDSVPVMQITPATGAGQTGQTVEHKVRLLPMPQRYSGTDPAVIVEDAIFSFESFLKASHIPMKDWPAHIMPILSGQALTTYVAHARPMSTRGEDMTWAHMVKILTDAFSTVDSKIVARKELLAIQQTTTVTEYAQRMRILIARAGSPASSDLDLMLLYFNGLKPYMQQKCQVDPTKGTFWGSFEQLLQFSLSVSVGTGPTQRPTQAQGPAWKTRGFDRTQGQGQGQGANMPDQAPAQAPAQPPTQVASGDARPRQFPPPPPGSRRDSNPFRARANAMKVKKFKPNPAPIGGIFCAGCARSGFMANHATGAAGCQTTRGG